MSRRSLATNAAGNATSTPRAPGTLSAMLPRAASPCGVSTPGVRTAGERGADLLASAVPATSIGAFGTQASGKRATDPVPATFTILRPASGLERAEQIRDIVDAFRRLRESIDRFNRLFAAAAGEPQPRGNSGASLQPLLTALARRVDGARFAQHRELKRAIRDARRLDKTRDALFSDAFSLDTDAMRRTAAELERLDTAFVRLGVGHVLARHREDARTTMGDAAARPPAAVDAGVGASMQRDAA